MKLLNLICGRFALLAQFLHEIAQAQFELLVVEAGDTTDLAEHAGPLMQRLLPLLDFVDKELELGLRNFVQKLREQRDANAD